MNAVLRSLNSLHREATSASTGTLIILARCWRRQPLLVCACLLACHRPEPTRKAEPSVPADTDGVATSGSRKPGPLVIVYPAAGDVWVEGRTYPIRWRAEGIDRVNIGVALGGKDKGHLALGLSASRDSLEWRIPPGFVSGFGIGRSDQMRVRIEDAGDPARYADSPFFTIVGPVKVR